MSTPAQKTHITFLCAQIAEERDSQRLLALVEELNVLLERERTLQNAQLSAPLPAASTKMISPLG
jgi:hypothetical protein